jgi:hypothetical protein
MRTRKSQDSSSVRADKNPRWRSSMRAAKLREPQSILKTQDISSESVRSGPDGRRYRCSLSATGHGNIQTITKQ